jgi:cell division protease FtsH
MKLDKDTMKKNWRNTLTPILFVIVLIGLYFFFNTDQDKPEPISFSQVVSEVKDGKVDKIEVNSDKLLVTLKTENGKDAVVQEAQKESEASLSETLVNYGVPADKISGVNITVKDLSSSQFWVGTVLPFVVPFIFIGAFIWFMFGRVQSGNKRAMSFGEVKGNDMTPARMKTTFKDVAGAREAKQELREIVEFLKFPGRFLALGAKIPKGVLLMGSPGTGKTLLAQALAGEAKVPYFHISGSEFVEMFVGVGASRVRDLFRKAKKAAPAIIFVDEIDAVGRQRGSGLGGSHDEREQTLNQILVEMDGFEPHDSVIVVAATNRPDVLDPALLRPGRFDRRVVLDVPDLEDRIEILKVHSRKKPMAKNIDLRMIAQRTPGLSGADLANILNEAAILAARRRAKEVTMADCLESIEKVLLGPERKNRIITEEEKKITAYHEGGHALVAYTLAPDADPVHKVSIIARGRAGGYTLKIPDKDRRLESKKQFLADLAVAMGGYAAEKKIFGDVTTGPSSDLKSASELARRIITSYGMSDKLGAVTFGTGDEMVFLGRELHDAKNYSEGTAVTIDAEVKLLVDNALHLAEKIITDHADKLDMIAEALLKYEVLEKHEFEAIMRGEKLLRHHRDAENDKDKDSGLKAESNETIEKFKEKAKEVLKKPEPTPAPEGGAASTQS